MKKGFTLIEMLVFLAVFGILSVVITSILMTFFRNENKIAATNNLRQYGSAIVDNFERDVRASDKVTTPSPPSSCGSGVQDCLQLSLTDISTTNVNWRCKIETVAGVPRLILTREVITYTGTSGELEGTNKRDGVFLTSCTNIFTVLVSGSLKLVTLNFTLQINPGGGQESSAQVPFRTSVSTRN
jgi:prepilin-type N-terminal cleavage/methylation domain-containing protein